MFSPDLPTPFPPQNSADRDALLDWVRGVSLVYGPWKTFKRLFKDVESAYSGSNRETEIMAALMARLDLAPFIDERSNGVAPPVLRGAFSALRVVGDLLYAIQGDNLAVYDLSAALEPREIFRYTPPESTFAYGTRLWLEGTRLVFGNSQLLRIFDLANPREPRFLFEFSAGQGNGIDIIGEHIFATDYENLRILNWPVSEGAPPIEAGRVRLQYGASIAAKKGIVAVSHYQLSGRKYVISFFDVSNPSAPVEVSEISSRSPNYWQFWNDILVSIEGNRLIFTDLSQPKKPRQISKIEVNGANRFHIVGDKVYVACSRWINENGRYGYEHKLRIIDIAQSHSPRLVGEVDANCAEMASYGDLLYIVDGGLRILDVSDTARIQMVGQRPKNVTFAYLKRRSRRFLRVLAEADGDEFVALAGALLEEAGQGHDALNLDAQWSSAELTLGGGQRWRQSSHGRGSYLKDPKKLVIKNREERAPQAWDRHLEAVRRLWNHPQLPWQTQEMALKILRSHGEQVEPTSAQLARFLWSDSPSLLAFAARHAKTRLNELESRSFAPLLWIVNPMQRREVLAFIEQTSALQVETATHLATLLGQNGQKGLARRAREIALLLAARFDLSEAQFDSNGAFPVIPLLIASAEAPLRALGLNLCRRLSAERAIEALAQLQQIPLAYRSNFIDSLLESASRGSIAVEQIDKIVRHPDAAIREAAWQLVAASQTSEAVLRAVWTKLFTGLRRESVYEGERYRSRYIGERWTESTALQSAVNSDAALLTLGRSGLTSNDVVPKFVSGMYAGGEQELLSAAMWGAYSLILPAKTVVDVIVALPTWTAWQTAWVRANGAQPPKLVAFWNAVQAYLSSDQPEAQKQILRERTFEQSAIAATFGGAASQLAPELLMSLIGAVPESVWAEWRGALLKALQNDSATREAFWSAARSSSALESGFLSARLLDDPEFAATFGLLETDALAADNPLFAPLILAWLRARETTLDRNGWIEAATHPLPAVRDFGLHKLEMVGLDIAGGLQLLESRLPPSIAFGQKWFQNRGENHLESALALCDSPQQPVRAFGRDFIAAHFESLLESGLLAYLQDNPNAEMQAFVARQLKERPELAAPEFDRTVLRSRHRARHAKTLIQERTSQGAPLSDDKTLLEIARCRTPRDREWAMTQLARRVMEGASVEGVEISGGAGI